MSTSAFYRDLPARTDFADFSEPSAYARLPDDWVMLLSDVTGSTAAIESGRYKQVNMAGAATIMATLNAIGDVAAPYVFGGDGATMAVPPSAAPAAKEALARAAGRARAVYGLDLRVAAIPASDLVGRGGEVSVMKLALGPTARLTLFNGDGVAMAERLLKDDDVGAPYRIAPSEDAPDLEGLSCRWEALQASHGVMLAIMIASVEGDAEAMADARLRIQAILGGDETTAAPVSNATLLFRWPPTGLMMEAAARFGRKAWRRFPGLLIETLAQAWAERFGKRAGPYDAPVYRQELLAQTDFRRYDGQLRMLLDVTEEQASAITLMLAEAYGAGRIVYGLHRADAALMTCLVFDLSAADHIHFIDGADGGFTVAARQMKAQLAERAAANA